MAEIEAHDLDENDLEDATNIRDAQYMSVKCIAEMLKRQLFQGYSVFALDFVLGKTNPRKYHQFMSWYDSSPGPEISRSKIALNCKSGTLRVRRAGHTVGAALCRYLKDTIEFWLHENVNNLGLKARDITKSLGIYQGGTRRFYDSQPQTTLRNFKAPYQHSVLDADLYFWPSQSGATGSRIKYPPVVLEYSWCETSDPQELLQHWKHLYSSRDIWHRGTDGATAIVLLALFWRSTSGYVNGRLDVWRWQGPVVGAKITDEIILFPPPPASSYAQKTLEFTLQEIFGASHDFDSKNSKVDPETAIVVDLCKMRERVSYYSAGFAFRREIP